MHMVEVVKIDIARRELLARDVPKLKEIFDIDKLPMATARVAMEMKGIPTAMVNAFRRTLTDEMIGHTLQISDDGWNTQETTELFMLPHFVGMRISSIRLKCQIPSETIRTLKLGLDMVNASGAPLSVYAGDLVVKEGNMKETLFNPTYRIAVIQPGKRMVIDEIKIVTGVGKDNGLFNVTCCAAFRHLDLEEYTDDEIRQKDGVASNSSGYKQSSLISNPKHHLLTFDVPATGKDYVNDVFTLLKDCIITIRDRLQSILNAIDKSEGGDKDVSGSIHKSGIQHTCIKLESGLNESVLSVPNETYTIGELLRRYVYEIVPEISGVSYEVISHERRLVLTVRNGSDTTSILMNTIYYILEVLSELEVGITTQKSK